MMRNDIRYLLWSMLTFVWNGSYCAQQTNPECAVGQLVSIIGKNNYAQARRGQAVDPKEFTGKARNIITDLEQNAADLKKIVHAIGAQSAEEAQAHILIYQGKTADEESDVGKLELSVGALHTEKVKKEAKIVEQNRKMQDIDKTIQELQERQKAPTKACDDKYKICTGYYAQAIGQKNVEALDTAIQQKMANPSIIQNLDQLLQLEFFPQNSSIALYVQEAKQKLDIEVQEAKTKIELVKKQLYDVKGALPVTTLPVPPAPEPEPTPVPQPNQASPALPEPVASQESNQQESVSLQEPVVTTPMQTASAPTPSATTDCEKKVIKLRMVMNYFSSQLQSAYGLGWVNAARDSFVAGYIIPVVKGDPWNPTINEQVDPLKTEGSELNNLPDCEKKIGRMKLVLQYCNKSESSCPSFFEEYIKPIIEDKDWDPGIKLNIKNYNYNASGAKKELDDGEARAKNTYAITPGEFNAIFPL